MMRLHLSLWHAAWLLLLAAIGILAIMAAPAAARPGPELALRLAAGALVVAWCVRSLLGLRRLYPLDLRYHRGVWQVHRHGSFADAEPVGTVWSSGALMLACLRCEGRLVPLFAGPGNMHAGQLCRLRRLVFQDSTFGLDSATINLGGGGRLP